MRVRHLVDRLSGWRQAVDGCGLWCEVRLLAARRAAGVPDKLNGGKAGAILSPEWIDHHDDHEHDHNEPNADQPQPCG